MCLKTVVALAFVILSAGCGSQSELPEELTLEIYVSDTNQLQVDSAWSNRGFVSLSAYDKRQHRRSEWIAAYLHPQRYA